jgi:hypothetical protein
MTVQGAGFPVNWLPAKTTKADIRLILRWRIGLQRRMLTSYIINYRLR